MTMEFTKEQGLVIKMSQKNKETQTGNSCFVAPPNSFSRISPSRSLRFYKNREEELYRQACRRKGISVKREEEEDEEEEEEVYDSWGSEDEPTKPQYRYTLDEMKSYNPYRFVHLKT